MQQAGLDNRQCTRQFDCSRMIAIHVHVRVHVMYLDFKVVELSVMSDRQRRSAPHLSAQLRPPEHVTTQAIVERHHDDVATFGQLVFHTAQTLELDLHGLRRLVPVDLPTSTLRAAVLSFGGGQVSVISLKVRAWTITGLLVLVYLMS